MKRLKEHSFIQVKREKEVTPKCFHRNSNKRGTVRAKGTLHKRNQCLPSPLTLPNQSPHPGKTKVIDSAGELFCHQSTIKLPQPWDPDEKDQQNACYLRSSLTNLFSALLKGHREHSAVMKRHLSSPRAPRAEALPAQLLPCFCQSHGTFSQQGSQNDSS